MGVDCNDNNIVKAEVLYHMASMLLDQKYEFMFNTMNVITRHWVTIGGMLKDLIERAFLDRE
jgi:hypothetical protein